MGDNSSIEWTDATWNPIVGCSRVSEGCDRCYAIGVVHRKMSPQHLGLTVHPEGERVDWNGQINVVAHLLDQPTRWRRPRRIFVNSLSDLFHPQALNKAVPWTDAQGHQFTRPLVVHVIAEMVANPRHTFQVLTKRPKMMGRLLSQPMFRLEVNAALMDRGLPPMPGGVSDPDFAWPAHIWWGTSIELDRHSWRADNLRRFNGTTWISAEPLLGPLPSLDLTGIDWLVVGGESGPGARPMHPDWARDLRDRCHGKVWEGVQSVTINGSTSTDVEVRTLPQGGTTAFFFKQWGDWGPTGERGVGMSKANAGRQILVGAPDDRGALEVIERVGKKQAGRELDGRTWDEMPEVA